MERIEATITGMEKRVNGGVWPIVITVILSVLILMGPVGKLNRFAPSVFPVDAVRWLETHPPKGRMFNAFDWGGYILFHLWPEQKVFIESQTDVIGEVTSQYETVVTLQPGWQENFERYDITWTILPPAWPLTSELISLGWETAYQDQTAVVLVK
jgi:hypothetical protein